MDVILARTAQIAILLIVCTLSYFLPRYGGLLGLLAAHVAVVLSVIVIAMITAAHISPDIPYEPLELLGYVAQGIALNIMLLPLSIWAMTRWRRLAPNRHHG